MEIPGFVEEWEKDGKEGTKMKLIWNVARYKTGTA